MAWKIKSLLLVRLCISLALVFSLAVIPVVAQTDLHVTGKVIDGSGIEVIGASVVVKGTTNGSVTGVDGTFSISVPSEKSVLQISFIGYESQEIIVGKRRTFEITLLENSQMLEDVVVVAYGTQSKATLTGSLVSADTKKLAKAPVASITNVLAGSLPGVSSVQTTGQPGQDAADIKIRGVGSLTSSNPLVLVDGVEREFSQIDPNEIENFSVLKDASATAVFGVRGANGVILITTKRGTIGKPTISFSSLTGLQQPMNYVEQTGSYEFARFWNIKMRNDGETDRKKYFTREDIEAFRTGSDPIMHPNSDWRKMVFNKFFLQTKNNINISGGTDNLRYFVSLGYLYQNGILKDAPNLPYDNNYKYNRYNYRANLDFKLTQTTTMKLGVGGNVGIIQEPNYNTDNPWIYATIWAVPMAGPGFLNGVRTLIPWGVYPVESRDAFDCFYGNGYKQKYRTTLNIDAEISQKLDFITKGLSISIKGAYDNRFDLHKNRTGGATEFQNVYYASYLEDASKPWTDPDYDKTLVYVPGGQITPLSYSESYGRDRNWYLEGRINYDHTFGDHKVTGLFLYNQSRDYYTKRPDDSDYPYQYIPRGYIGFVGRATYGYKSKYLIDVNAGYNGSENFAPGSTRYGFFPSGSIGWIISEENFMKNQRIIDFLKLRASWGKVGNDYSNGSRFIYMPSVWSVGGNYSFGVNNPNGQEAYGVGTPGNDKVTWETATKQNYGFDLKMLDSRLSLNVDVFFEKRKGILISPNSTPGVIAMGLPNLNLGKVDNHGYEIALGWDETLNSGLRYYVNANVSFARNKVIFMDEVRNEYDYMNRTGKPVNTPTNLYKFERIYQYSDFIQNTDGTYTLKPELPQPSAQVCPGDAMYADLNGDMIVDSKDKMTHGYTKNPEYIFGLISGFSYKGFNFNMQWTGATHVDKMLEIEYRIPFTNAGKRGLLQYFYNDCWTPENQLEAKLPRASKNSMSWNSEPSTLWLRDASYLRLKTVSLSYTFQNKMWLKPLGIKSLELSLTGYNLLTFSPMDILDPESLATNNGGYPLVKNYSLGLNVNF